MILQGEKCRRGNRCSGKLNNRVRAAKVCVYCSANGQPNYFTLQHLAEKKLREPCINRINIVDVSPTFGVREKRVCNGEIIFDVINRPPK